MVRKLYRITWQQIRLLPDRERLWRALRQKDQLYPTGEIKPSFFRDRSGLSCDLARFSTPEASRRGHGEQAYPAEAGLVEFSVLDVRAIGSDVLHVPVKTTVPVARAASFFSRLRLRGSTHSIRNYAHAQFTSYLERPEAEQLILRSFFLIEQRFKVEREGP